jgi:hypothetical protein
MKDALHWLLRNGAESQCTWVIGRELDELTIIISRKFSLSRTAPDAAFANLRKKLSPGQANTRIRGESLEKCVCDLLPLISD